MKFKLVVIGDGGVGKTSLIRRHLTGNFVQNYTPTKGVEQHHLSFHTSRGHIQFTVWDYAGVTKFSDPHNTYYQQADAAILMFDRSNIKSYHNVTKWYDAFRKVCPTTPVVIVGNKLDVRKPAVQANHITVHLKLKLQYFDISAKSCYNFDKPFLQLLRTLVGDPRLRFVKATCV